MILGTIAEHGNRKKLRKYIDTVLYLHDERLKRLEQKVFKPESDK